MTKKYFMIVYLGIIFLLGILFFTAPKAMAASLPTSEAINSTGPTSGSGIFNSGNTVVTPYYTVGQGGYSIPSIFLSVTVPNDNNDYSITIHNAGAGCSGEPNGVTAADGTKGPDFGNAVTEFMLYGDFQKYVYQNSGGSTCKDLGPITFNAAKDGLLTADGNNRQFFLNAVIPGKYLTSSQENAFKVTGSSDKVLIGVDANDGDDAGYGYRYQDINIGQHWGFDIVFGVDAPSSCTDTGTYPSVTGQVNWKDADPNRTDWNDEMVFSLWSQLRSADPSSGNWTNLATYSQQRGQIGTNGSFSFPGNNTFTADKRYMVTFENIGTRNTIWVGLPAGQPGQPGLSQLGGQRTSNPPACNPVATCNYATAGINPANINQASPFTVNISNNGKGSLNSSYSLHQTYWSSFDGRRVGLSRLLTGGNIGGVPYTGPGYLGPGQSGDFNFNVSRVAPGTYYFDFQMQQNGNLVGNNCHLELTVRPRPACNIFGNPAPSLPYGGGTVSYGVDILNGSNTEWGPRHFMTEEVVGGARNNIGDLVKVLPGAYTREFYVTHTVTTTTTFKYDVWVSSGVPGGADGHYYAPATPFYWNGAYAPSYMPGPTIVVRDHGHYPPYADHLHWNHSNRIQLPGHWTGGTWVAGHWNGRHWKNGRWVGGTWVAGHWENRQWVAGPWVGGEDGHADLPIGTAPGSTTCSVTVTVADPPTYSSAGSFTASCKAIDGNIWYQGTGGAPRGWLRIIRNSDGASMGDVGVGAWDGSGPKNNFDKDPFRSWRLAPHDTYTVQLYGLNSAGDPDPMLYSAPLNGGSPCLRVQSCNITTDTAPEPGQATTATISMTTANSTSVPFDPSYGYSVSFSSTGSSVSPPSGNQPVSIGTGVSNTSPPVVLNIVANYRIDINADLYYDGAPFQPGSGCNVSIKPATLPYFKSFQGDIKAGGVFKNVDGSCNIGAAKYGAILGYARPTTTNGGRRGASTDFGAYALGLIHGTPGGPYGFYGSAINNASYKNLSFANIGNGLAQDLGGGYMAGNATARPSIGTNHCVTNYFDGASKKLKPNYTVTNTVDPTNLSGSGTDSNNITGQYFYKPSTYETLAGGTVTGSATIFVDGNVYISSNITYGPWNPMDTANAPYLTIIAKGNITVAPGVTRLDGLYIAQGGSSPGSGIFATCASPSNPAQPANAAEISANCRQQLVVNGAVIAQQAMLLRSNGTLLLAPSGNNFETSTYCNSITPTPCSNPAEIFNYMPSMILIQPNLQAEGSGAMTPGLLQGIFSLPPVF